MFKQRFEFRKIEDAERVRNDMVSLLGGINGIDISEITDKCSKNSFTERRRKIPDSYIFHVGFDVELDPGLRSCIIEYTRKVKPRAMIKPEHRFMYL